MFGGKRPQTLSIPPPYFTISRKKDKPYNAAYMGTRHFSYQQVYNTFGIGWGFDKRFTVEIYFCPLIFFSSEPALVGL